MTMDQSVGVSSFPSWIRGPLLGCGAYGSVNLALERQTGQLFAVKSVNSDGSSHHLEALENEYEILQLVKSDRVVRCLGADWTREDGVKSRNLKLEYVAGGSVADLMKKFGRKSEGSGGKLEEPLIRQYTKGVLEGLRDLHSLGIAHLDIKGKNVLVDNGGVKLCDLGAAVRVGQRGAELQTGVTPAALNSRAKLLEWGVDRCRRRDGTSETGPGSPSSCGKMNSNTTCNTTINTTRFRGTICWMAPELVHNAEPDTSADIWSVGCTVIEMATGKVPWAEHARDAYAALFRLGCTTAVPQFPATLSPEGLDFLDRCLQRDPAKRPSAEELLAHPFLKPMVLTPLSVAPVAVAPHVSKQTTFLPPASPTSVLCDVMSNDWSRDRSFPRSFALRRTGSEAATASTRGPESHEPLPTRCPSLGSFPSFSQLASSSLPIPNPNPRPSFPPPLSVQIPTLDVLDEVEAKSTAEIARCPSEDGNWSWWSSLRSPQATQGQWITVHSSPSTPLQSPAWDSAAQAESSSAASACVGFNYSALGSDGVAASPSDKTRPPPDNTSTSSDATSNPPDTAYPSTAPRSGTDNDRCGVPRVEEDACQKRQKEGAGDAAARPAEPSVNELSANRQAGSAGESGPTTERHLGYSFSFGRRFRIS